MATLVLSPIGNGFQFFGSNTAASQPNLPLTAGLLWIYQAGTTTPVTTYTSAAGSIANTNPIVLQSDGRPPYEIWWAPGASYKMVLQDSSGNAIPNGTYDNIPGINDPFAISANATQIVYTPPGTGAVATTVAAKLAQTVSVIDFGADPTGVGDSTASIQAAINSLPAWGGTVYFPYGTYKISTQLSVGNGTGSVQSTKQCITLMGSTNPVSSHYFGGLTASTSKIVWGGGVTSGSMISYNGAMQGGGMQNLLIDSNFTTKIGLQITSCLYSEFRNISILNCTDSSTGGCGLYITSLVNNVGDANSEGMLFSNIYVVVPDYTGCTGISLNGYNGGGNISDTDFCTFINTRVFIAQGTHTGKMGIYLSMADSNAFYNTQLFGGDTFTTAIVCDFSNGLGFPTGNRFYSVDTRGSTGLMTQYGNIGTPSGPEFNYIDFVTTNGSSFPTLPGFSSPVVQLSPTVNLTGQTATIAPTTLFNVRKTQSFRLSFYLECTTAGTGGSVTATFGWTNNGVAHNSGAIQTTALTSTGAGGGYSFIIHADGGSYVQYWSTVSGALGSPQYQYVINVEKLG